MLSFCYTFFFSDSSEDYALLEGSDLIINCTLKDENITISGKLIDSSYLIIAKYTQDMSNYTRVIDDRTIQMKIPKATLNDAGYYVCKIFLHEKNDPIVCGTKVSVGCKYIYICQINIIVITIIIISIIR